MSQQPLTADLDPVDVELVAYLDGELEAGDRAQVERRLADDEAFRTRLRLLQRTWDALDVLGRADVGEQFTRTTVELVAVKAAEEVTREQSRRTKKRAWSWIGWTVAAVAAAAAGWLILAGLLDEPNRRLLSDLPVIEHVEEYRNADSVEFVQALAASRLFAAEMEDEGAEYSPAAAAKSMPERARQIAALQPEDKVKLLSRNERFLALSPAEQDRLRRFHERISRADDSAEMMAALVRYGQWLKSLTPQQQAELAGLSIEERLAKIKEIQQFQVRAHFWQLAWRLEKDDLDMIYGWMEDLVWRHQDAIVARMDTNSTLRFYSTFDPKSRRGMLLWSVFGRGGSQLSELLPPAAAEDFAALAVRLPASLQVQLTAQRTDEDRRDLILTCARVAFWSRHAPPPPSDEELRKYFATLDAAEVERLERMDSQQMKRELTRLYQFRRPREGRAPQGSGDSGRSFSPKRGRSGEKRPADAPTPEQGRDAKKTGGQTPAQPPEKTD